MKRRRLTFLAAFLTALFCTQTASAEAPWESHALTLETGLLWGVGENTPLSYRIVPVQLSWRSRRAFGREFADGSQLLVRHRVTLIADLIQQGPESRYVAFSFSPSIEHWNKAGTWGIVGGAGGGFGLIDSQNVVGAQGQDFTLNWFARAGIEHISTQQLRITAGLMFQHMSNGGMTDPNPGIDLLGFTIGCSWKF